MPKHTPCCPKCGSRNVTADSASRWDDDAQLWETSCVFDEGHSCEDCGETIAFEWKQQQLTTTREATCERIGANIYGRTDAFLCYAEQGDDDAARRELLALLKFFPRKPRA